MYMPFDKPLTSSVLSFDVATHVPEVVYALNRATSLRLTEIDVVAGFG